MRGCLKEATVHFVAQQAYEAIFSAFMYLVDLNQTSDIHNAG